MRLSPVFLALAAISRLVHCEEGGPGNNVLAQFLASNEVEIEEISNEIDHDEDNND
eukprot:CAMPEP_0194272722 /NCGR_PEP_ID=MMETSP0169-20130528/6205_1 /TAXON_ID=218684 /ORGANISM="Corethron pennatum, Strain L29A3" /LENGTH=55 /DNA_ID=CAMNT_0039015449 /DNA_START=58 /DNA_END=222 /DNA_ORIENTATION=-